MNFWVFFILNRDGGRNFVEKVTEIFSRMSNIPNKYKNQLYCGGREVQQFNLLF